MKVVTPYRPFPAESVEHRELGDFDWLSAIRMMRESVHQSCQCDTFVITDVDIIDTLGTAATANLAPLHAFQTTHRRLMLWILEVSLAYLDSPRFDEDTVMVCPDLLVFDDLESWFDGWTDLGILVRTDQRFIEAGRPILNSVQWWSHQGRERLVAFYREVLALAEMLPEDVIRWGADSESLRQALEPLDVGVGTRLGAHVRLIDASTVLETYADTHRKSKPGKPNRPTKAVMDFRYLRKRSMADYYTKTIGKQPA